MHYHIDTIPVWDAVKLEGECPLCALRRRNELIDVDRFLGASVMEPDTRIRVNEKGFCARHQVLLYAQKNRLGHALMMHTHLRETMKKMDGALKAARNAGKKSADTPALKRMMGKNEGKDDLLEAARRIRSLSDQCILCESIEENTRRYAYTLLHLYKTDSSFRRAFAASKGVCLPDMALLMEMAGEALSGSILSEFIHDLCAAVERSLEKMEGDLEGFTLKFDYRNADKPWGDSKDALERTVNKLQSWCIGTEPNPK
ncbi:MAG: hypothetical protein IJD39_01895 [Clostridia bacterium]|nr:hypothetical protein [Clostridia bacterium]